MFNWNVVYLMYCDGGSWTGDRDQPLAVGGAALEFRGKQIRDGVEAALLRPGFGLAAATDVVVSGASAGALAVFLTLDRWCDGVHARAGPGGASCVGLPDSGFFLDIEQPVPPNTAPPAPGMFHRAMKWAFAAFNSTSGVDASCVAHYTAAAGDPSACFFAEHVSPFIRAPVFALQSIHDSFQIGSELRNATPAMVNQLGANISARLSSALLASSHPDTGAFLDSCEHHCFWGSSDDLFETIKVEGQLVLHAFAAWYRGLGNRSAKKVWRDERLFPCAACCGY